MTKITLKNGITVEFETPKEAAQFIHTLNWREYQQETRSDLIQKFHKNKKNKKEKLCTICKEPLKPGKHSLCGKESCAKENRRRYQRKWYRQHPGYVSGQKKIKKLEIKEKEHNHNFGNINNQNIEEA